MAIFRPTEVTEKGLALLAKVLAGRCKLRFTLIQAGDGVWDEDVVELTSIVNHRLDGRIVSVREMGVFTEIRAMIDNSTLTEFMEFREIALLAEDPDEGEITFAYSSAEHPSPIGAWNGTWLHEEEFTINVYTANATNIKATITPVAFASQVKYSNILSGLNAENTQDAIDELSRTIKNQSSIIISDEEPTEPSQIWLKPHGGAISNNTGSGITLNISGAHVGDSPPTDTGNIWFETIEV